MLLQDLQMSTVDVETCWGGGITALTSILIVVAVIVLTLV